jgi:hypothetical protein
MNRRLVAVVVLGLLVVSLPALAQMRERGMMAQRGAAAGLGGNPLDLTADQMTKIRTINLQFEKDMIALRANLQSKRLDLLSLVEAKADRKRIEAAVDTMTPAIGDILKASLAHWTEVRGVLSADQQARLDGMMGPGLGMGHSMGMGLGMGTGRGCMQGPGDGWGMGMMGRDDDIEGHGWGMNMWRNMCPRWW